MDVIATDLAGINKNIRISKVKRDAVGLSDTGYFALLYRIGLLSLVIERQPSFPQVLAGLSIAIVTGLTIH